MLIQQESGHRPLKCDGYIGTPNTLPVYAISCAAPRSCGAGGNLGGYHGLPSAVVADETVFRVATEETAA